jgi:hypothetical protein
MDEVSIDKSSSVSSLPSTEPSLVPQSPSTLPLISSSTSIPSQIKKTSYCSQLLSVMDNKQLSNDNTSAKCENLSVSQLLIVILFICYVWI